MQARHVAQRNRETRSQDPLDVRDGVAKSRRATKPRMDSLHDSRTRTSHLTIQVCAPCLARGNGWYPILPNLSPGAFFKLKLTLVQK